MKKMTKLTAFLLIVAMLIPALASCAMFENISYSFMNEREKAIFKLNRGVDNADAADSYTGDATISFDAEISGQSTSMKMETKTYSVDNELYVSVSEMTTKMEGQVISSQSSEGGYMDGKMFEGEDGKGFYSVTSSQDYKKYMEEDSGSFDFDADFVTEISNLPESAVKFDEELMKISVGQFSEETISELCESFQLDGLISIFGLKTGEPSIEMSFELSEDDYFDAIKMKVTYPQQDVIGEDALVVDIDLGFSDWNEPIDTAELPDISGYTEIPNMIHIKRISDFGNDFILKDSGEYTYMTAYSLTAQGTTAGYSEVDKVSYTFTPSMTYDIDVSMKNNGQSSKFEVKYENGKQKTYMNGSVADTQQSSDAAAKALITAQLNLMSVCVDLTMIESIAFSEVGDKVTYTFTYAEGMTDISDALLDGQSYINYSSATTVTKVELQKDESGELTPIKFSIVSKTSGTTKAFPSFSTQHTAELEF